MFFVAKTLQEHQMFCDPKYQEIPGKNPIRACRVVVVDSGTTLMVFFSADDD